MYLPAIWQLYLHIKRDLADCCRDGDLHDTINEMRVAASRQLTKPNPSQIVDPDATNINNWDLA